MVTEPLRFPGNLPQPFWMTTARPLKTRKLRAMSADYTESSLTFRLRKALRYTRLYGPAKTIAKVRGQYHMASTAASEDVRWENPTAPQSHRSARRGVAIVGCGNFAFSMIAHTIYRTAPQFLRATCDPNLGRAKSLCKRYHGDYATCSFDEIINDDSVDLVIIASNHSTHATYAARAIRAGKAVHIEKPHAVTWDQLTELHDAISTNPAVPVFLGFNRPKSNHFQMALGAIKDQEGPSMVSWFIAGHEIEDDHWYFSPEEGGRVLGNLCHWLDLTLHAIGLESFFPCILVPGSEPRSRSDFSLSIQCADKSLATFSFSAKGHTFEGVREVLNLHRGDVLISLSDFKETRCDNGPQKKIYRSLFRDHGHEANILNSYQNRLRPEGGERVQHIVASAAIALAARDALELGSTIELADPSLKWPERELLVEPNQSATPKW